MRRRRRNRRRGGMGPNLGDDTATSVVRAPVSILTDANGKQTFYAHMGPGYFDPETQKKYAFYRIVSARVRYMPLVGSQFNGSVSIAFFPNCVDGLRWTTITDQGTQRAQLMWLKHKHIAHASVPGSFSIDQASLNGVSTWKPVEGSHPHAGEDVMEDPGYLVFMADGAVSTTFGYIVVELTIQYRSLVTTLVNT